MTVYMGLHAVHLTDAHARDRLQTMQTNSSLPDPDENPTITITAAARIAGVAKRTGYAAAQRGEWPVVRTGRSVRVRTRDFLEQCGFEVTP